MAKDFTSALNEETKRAKQAQIDAAIQLPPPALGTGLSGIARPVGGVPQIPAPQSSAPGVIAANSVAPDAVIQAPSLTGATGSVDNEARARENKIRGEMVALSMPQVGGTAPGLLGVGFDGKTDIERDNAEKTARWRQDDLLRMSTRGNQAAVGAAINANARSDDMVGNNSTSLQTASMQADAARYGHDINAQRTAGHDNVLMRGQDMTSANEAARIAGNPIDNKTKQLQLDSAIQVAGLQKQYMEEVDPAKKAALAEQMRVLGGKDKPASFSAIHASGGTRIDPKNPLMTTKEPDVIGHHNAATGQIDFYRDGVLLGKDGRPTVGGNANQAPPGAVDLLKKNAGNKDYVEAFKQKYRFLPEGF